MRWYIGRWLYDLMIALTFDVMCNMKCIWNMHLICDMKCMAVRFDNCADFSHLSVKYYVYTFILHRSYVSGSVSWTFFASFFFFNSSSSSRWACTRPTKNIREKGPFSSARRCRARHRCVCVCVCVCASERETGDGKEGETVRECVCACVCIWV